MGRDAKPRRALGFALAGSTNGYYYGFEPLNRAVEELQARETAEDVWTLVKELSPFATIKGRNYPVILSFVGEDGRVAASRLEPQVMGELLRRLWNNTTTV